LLDQNFAILFVTTKQLSPEIIIGALKEDALGILPIDPIE
jgi:hypothetical protein